MRLEELQGTGWEEEGVQKWGWGRRQGGVSMIKVIEV